MTKKEYIKLAKVIKDEEPSPDSVTHAMWNNLAIALADMLQDDNPQFDYDNFLSACGVTS